MSLKNSYVDFEVGDRRRVAAYLRSFKIILKNYSHQAGLSTKPTFEQMRAVSRYRLWPAAKQPYLMWPIMLLQEAREQDTVHSVCICVCVFKASQTGPIHSLKKNKQTVRQWAKIREKNKEAQIPVDRSKRRQPQQQNSLTVITCAYIPVDNCVSVFITGEHGDCAQPANCGNLLFHMLAQQLKRWRSCYIVYITRKACTCSAWNRANRSIHSLNIAFPSHSSILKSCYWHCNPSWKLLAGSFYF